MERMVGKRLSYTLEKHTILSRFQCGFRPNHSPVDHLVRLETDIRQGFKNKQHTIAVFLDIKKAYDMVHKPALIQKIHKIGIRGHMAFYLCNFLSGARHVRVRYRSLYSDIQDMENGLTQGSCLSPLLFNIFIDDLFDNVPQQIRYSLYADDAALWCTAADCDRSVSHLQTSISILENWSRRNGLQFSTEKSIAMVFSRQTTAKPSFRLHIYNNNIPYVNSFKFLGVVLDRNLSMAQHIKYIKAKCSSRLNLFRCLTSSECCADRTTLLRLYKALVLPVIEYGAAMYAGGRETALASLETVQNSFLRIALGVMKTSPISALQVEANIPPLSIRRKELTLRYYSKIKQFPDHTSYPAIHSLPRLHHNYLGPCERRTGLTIASRVTTYCDQTDIHIPDILPTPALIVSPWQLHPRQVFFLFQKKKTDISKQEIQQLFAIFQAEHNDFQFIYTDGSKDGTRTGNGIFTEGLRNLQGRLPDNTSVYVAELHAVFVALRLIEHYNIRKACVCSDSKSALQCLINPSFKDHLHFRIVNIHQKLLDTGASISFLWILGHSGIIGNERADNIAKGALNLQQITNIAVSQQTIRSSIRHRTTSSWEQRWRNDKKTQLHDIKPKIELWSSSSRKNRLEEKTLARLRLGHTSLTHSYIYQQSDRPLCLSCNTSLTVRHLLLHCGELNRRRQPLIDYCRIQNIDFGIATLLGDEHPDLLHLLFEFLRKTDLITRL